MLPVFLDFLCTSNGLSTYLDQNVVKLPNSSLTSSCSQLASFYANFLPSPTVPICSLSPPVPIHDYSKPPCFYFSLNDFCDLLYFKRCFYTDSADLDDELGQWCLGAYKHMDCKVKPIPAHYPKDARVHRRFLENPLDSLMPLSPLPPDFIPTKKLTIERLALMKLNVDGFLWPEEEKLFAHVMKLNEAALAFDKSERGNFHSDYCLAT